VNREPCAAPPQPEIRERTDFHQRRSRPFFLVGDDQSGLVGPEHRVRLVVKPRFVAELGRNAATERAQQSIEQCHVTLADGRKLQKHRAHPVAQRRHALGDDARQADAIELCAGVREAAMGLHAEPKVCRGPFTPLDHRGLGRRAVEAAVQLDTVQPLRVVREHPSARQRGWIELPLPGRIAETGRAGVETAYDV